MYLTKRFNYTINTVLLIFSLNVVGQELTLESCIDQALRNSSLSMNGDLIEKQYVLLNNNEWSGNLPQASISGTATYQSDVFTFPGNIPGSDIPVIPKDQYQLNLGLSQKIYDGGLGMANKKMNLAQRDIKTSDWEVSQHQLIQAVSNIYFQIITVEENYKILQSLDQELSNQLQRAEVSFENGTVLNSSLNSIRKELLLNNQRNEEMLIHSRALKSILSELTGVEVSDDLSLKSTSYDLVEMEIDRPEVELLNNRSLLIEANKDAVTSTVKPRVSGFANLGYGQPNQLNFFETDFSEYYILGLKVEWKVWDWKRHKRSVQSLSVDQQLLDASRLDLVRKINRESILKRAEIDKKLSLIGTDEELLALQSDITREATIQHDLGTLSTTDYLTELTNKTQAELQLSKHKIELQKSIVELMILTGNMP